MLFLCSEIEMVSGVDRMAKDEKRLELDYLTQEWLEVNRGRPVLKRSFEDEIEI